MKLTSFVEGTKSRTEEVVDLVRKVEGWKRGGGLEGKREEGRKGEDKKEREGQIGDRCEKRGMVGKGRRQMTDKVFS